MSGQVGRAELLMGLAEASTDEAREKLADLLGFRYAPRAPASLVSLSTVSSTPVMPASKTEDRAASLSFLQATRAQYIAPDDTDEARDDRVRAYEPLKLDEHVPKRPGSAIVEQDWFPWSIVEPRLLSALGEYWPTGRVDEPYLVRWVARLRPWKHVPRKMRQIWPQKVGLLIDDRPSGLPFFDEMVRTAVRIRARVGPEKTTLASADARISGDGPTLRLPMSLDSGTRGLALGLDGWITSGEGAAVAEDTIERQRVEALLVALAPAVRIETSLLKAVAFEHSAQGFTAETVLRTWNHAWLDRGTTRAAGWMRGRRQQLLERWSNRLRMDSSPDSLERSALRIILEHHAFAYAPSLWYEERAAALAQAPLDDPIRGWLKAAEADDDPDIFYQSLKMTTSTPVVAGWLRSVVDRNPALLADQPGFQVNGVNPIKVAYENVVLGLAHDELPTEITLTLDERSWGLMAVEQRLESSPETTAYLRSSGLSIMAAYRPVSYTPLRRGFELGTWHRGAVMNGTSWSLIRRRALDALHAENPWAAEVDEDEFGVWADVELAGIRFRMRWIPPGSFTMGSAEDEAERWSVEGPQHEVTLTEGYWLAEAPCTQALWHAVMGDDPSHFKGDDLP
ncbi:MAG: SUMF1/EgtB/PvdO family nonheme iron enzyme, partial [Myxococcota bacterium]